jgi:hypothetical protein
LNNPFGTVLEDSSCVMEMCQFAQSTKHYPSMDWIRQNCPEPTCPVGSLFNLVGETVGDDVDGEPVGDEVGYEIVGEPVGDVVGDDVVGEPVGDVGGDDVVGEPVGDVVGDEGCGRASRRCSWEL